MDAFTAEQWRDLQEFLDCPNRMAVVVELLKQMQEWIQDTLALPFLTDEEAAAIIKTANERAMKLAKDAKERMEREGAA